MPALDPVCGRTGALLSTSDAAVTNASARETGLARVSLLGGLATIIGGKFIGPSVRDAGYGRNRWRSTQGRRIRGIEAGATKPGEYGSSGAGLR